MSSRKTKRTATHRYRALLWACGLLAFITVLATAGVSAKYIHQTEVQGQAVAAEFYFASDFLSENGETHTVTALENGGTASVTFALQNHADELRYSEVDIAYTVSVKPAGDVTVTPASGTISAGKNANENQTNDAAITISGLKRGKTYTVTATATTPYTATLTGTITVQERDDTVHCEVTDKTQYIEVTVYTVDYSGNVQITYPAKLIPDNTDSVMADWKTEEQAQTKTVKMEANSAHVFRFFKASGYTGSGSEVTANAAK